MDFGIGGYCQFRTWILVRNAKEKLSGDMYMVKADVVFGTRAA